MVVVMVVGMVVDSDGGSGSRGRRQSEWLGVAK